MHVLGHDHGAVDAHAEAPSHGFEAEKEEIEDGRRSEVTVAVITGEGDKVRLSGVVIPAQTAGHMESLHLSGAVGSDGPRLASKGRTRTWGTRLKRPN